MEASIEAPLKTAITATLYQTAFTLIGITESLSENQHGKAGTWGACTFLTYSSKHDIFSLQSRFLAEFTPIPHRDRYLLGFCPFERFF